ncbi:cationic amino acid transporter 3-like [Actinia tenebrosa]|uniref:Cationic amino acid transporter 3-like n=1 Tax=Actinia tenebrosa TaxID=6105 RepID=A0A6P8IYS9_ACTTE|nr:cationic amino acid transporter 3-like [Actinia tenebrosa]XP_031572329.1 cationic amino acid transporter 3-like [Actinia tenebrosa]XP_031572330.1 cationic amino acid transporter 3-like [Actinia tenebrosa]
MPRVMDRMLRRKSQGTWFIEGPLVRCMNLFDLTVLGLGGLIDAGIYVVIGQLALRLAGPAVIISFLIAAIAAVLSGLCYAELSSRITKTGSAYVYAYVVLGELWAFLTGWSMIAEYLVNAASMARAFVGYVNSLTGDSMYDLFRDKISWGMNPLFGNFPNFPALFLVIVAAVIVGLGVRESKMFMDGITSINGTVIVFAIVSGCVFADTENWSSLEKFAPNGISGILMAAPSCFYCLSGFDAIPTASEEALDPRHGVSSAILLSLTISITAYFCVATVLTLMVPYNAIVGYAPLAEAFLTNDFEPGYYIVTIGALCAVFGSLLATTFATTRLVYSIAYDGLISSCFARVSERTHVPFIAVITTGILTGILAACIDMTLLVELVSVATITTYTMVSLCVLLSRYQTDVGSVYLDGYLHTSPSVAKWLEKRLFPKATEKAKTIAAKNYEKISRLDRPEELDKPEFQSRHRLSKDTQYSATIALIFFTLCLLGFWTSFDVMLADLSRIDPVALSLMCLYGITCIVTLGVLLQMPRNNAKFPFMVPMAIPIVSIVINTFMLVRIHWASYYMFCSWTALGMAIYFVYGYSHSTESHAQEEPEVFMDYAVVPGLPMGTEVISPVQAPLKRKNPFEYTGLEYEPEEIEQDEFGPDH